MSTQIQIPKMPSASPETANQLIGRDAWENAMATHHDLGSAAMANIVQPLTIRQAELVHPGVTAATALNLLYGTKEDDIRAEAVLERVEPMAEARVEAELSGEPVVSGKVHDKEVEAALMS